MLGTHGSSAAQSVNPEAEKMLEEVRKSQKISGDVLLKVTLLLLNYVIKVRFAACIF